MKNVKKSVACIFYVWYNVGDDRRYGDMNDNEKANYLTTFKIQIIRHIRETYTFSDTSYLSPMEIKEAIKQLCNRAVPIAPKTFDWLRSMLRFVRDKDQWLVYDNTTGLWHYEVSDNQLRALLCDYFQAIYEAAYNAGDDIYMGYACAFFGTNKIAQLMIRLRGAVQFIEPSAAKIIERNYNIRYFDTTEGSKCIIDISKDQFNMRTVKFSETQPMLLQAQAPVPISTTDEEPKLWLSLIDEYMLHDPVKVAYFYKVLAYMMSPYNYNQVLLYWIGDHGRNGKGTIVKVLQDILGPYATRLNSDLINANPAPSFKKDDALASTEGRSLLIFNEIDERMVASTQSIKDLTEGGRDKFGNKIMTVVRPAYSRNYEINISGTPLIIANSLLNMGEWSNLEPIFRRLILVSFDYKIQVEDPTLLDRLAMEYPKIQTWLYLNYFKHKGVLLKDEPAPADWQRRFDQYINDSDIIKLFWNDCFTITNSPNDMVLRGTVYKMYTEYCKANGRKPIKNKGTNGFAVLARDYMQPEVILHGNVYIKGIKQSSYYLNEVVQ